MEHSNLMFNGYNPYGDFNSDIGSIIETEKQVNNENIQRKKICKVFFAFDVLCSIYVVIP